MKRLKKIIRYLFDSDYRFLINAYHGRFDAIDDIEYLSRMYRAYCKKDIDWSQPKDFTEKLQWLKVNNRKTEYHTYVDKYSVRQYIEKKIGREYLVPLLGVWDTADDIDFNALPNQFVLKCTHNSGKGMCICKDKSKVDFSQIQKELADGLQEDYYLQGREWPYKNIPRRIIAEVLLVDDQKKESDIRDYKFYCFNGVPRFCQVITNRSEDERIDFFDMEWNHMPFKGVGFPLHPFSDEKLSCPFSFSEMKGLAVILSAGIPFVRIDFYEVNKRVFFGEITFFPASGFGGFYPIEWNKRIGDMINLNN